MLRWNSMKCILDYLLGINVYISFILSLSRHNMSRTVSIWFKMSMVHMTPVPSLHSDFFYETYAMEEYIFML